MKPRLSVKSALASTLALSAVLPAAHGQTPAPQPVELKDGYSLADHVSTDGAQTILTGHVHVTFVSPARKDGAPAETVLTADTITIDHDAKTATAEGNVTATSQGHVTTGTRLVYQYEAQTGRFEVFTASEYGMLIQGRLLEYTPGHQIIFDAVLNTCGTDKPDVRVVARRVDVTTNQRIHAHGVGIDLFGHRAAGVPNLTYEIQNGQAGRAEGLPIPRPGHTRLSGFTLAQPVPVNDSLNGMIDLTSKRGIVGSLRYQPLKPEDIVPYVRAAWKEEHLARDTSGVLVSTLPEAGLLFGQRRQAAFRLGYYHEYGSDVTAGRAQVDWKHNILTRGENLGLNLSVNARGDAYTTHQSYGSAGFEASVGRGNREIYQLIGLRENIIVGHTPFIWDEVQIQTEVFGGVGVPMGKLRLETNVRYDLSRKEIYDVRYGIGRRFKCLEPILRYSTHRRAVFVGFNIFGLGQTEAGAETDDASDILP